MCYIPPLDTYMVFFKDFFYLWNDRISHKNSVKWGEKKTKTQRGESPETDLNEVFG